MIAEKSDIFNLIVILFIIILNQSSRSISIQFQFGPCLLQYLEPCSENVIQYYLFTSDRPNSAPLLLDAKKPVIPEWIRLNKNENKMIVHGYGGHLDFHATKIIRSAYLQKNNTNVIIVDWGRLAKLPCYPTAAFNTKQAGECIGSFLLKIQNQFESDKHFQQIHLVGFSLGAHVVGFASNIVKKTTGLTLNRITGLDPALPFFATSNNQWKLDRSDAKFVDIIHTNAGIYGKIEPSGHVDFYLNGGQMQPACVRKDNGPLCSHMLATVYFAESINATGAGFWGTKCRSYWQYMFGLCQETRKRHSQRIQMGEYCLNKSKGMVFIETDSKSPYALG